MDKPHRKDSHEEEAQKAYGVMGYFLTPGDLMHACEKLKTAGYKHFDAHTPFPVHGLERAMGLPPSNIPWVVRICGITGLASAIALTYYCSMDYPLTISGKPSFSYQAYVPIMFELTVLFSALGTFIGVWAMNKLPAYYHPTMTHPSFPRATDDAFFISIEARDPKYNASRTKKLLEELGAREVMEVMD
jgi:hypothetical protein